MSTPKRIRGFYVHATAWSFDSDVQPHIEKMRRTQADEFDNLLNEARSEAWDEGYDVGNRGQRDPNPYRKGN